MKKAIEKQDQGNFHPFD